MNSLNFKSSDKELIASGIDFSSPVVIAIESAKNGNGFNALIVQKLQNVPSAGSGTVSSGNAMLDKIKQAQFERSGNSMNYFGRTFQWYSEKECPTVSQVFTEDTIIVYDTINETEVLAFTNKPENLIRKEKEENGGGNKLVGGEVVYRLHLLAKKADQISHVVLKTDKTETEIKEIQRSASKIS